MERDKVKREVFPFSSLCPLVPRSGRRVSAEKGKSPYSSAISVPQVPAGICGDERGDLLVHAMKNPGPDPWRRPGMQGLRSMDYTPEVLQLPYSFPATSRQGRLALKEWVPIYGYRNLYKA